MGKFNSRHFSLEKAGEGIYAAISKADGGAMANAGFVDLGDQTIVFDTFNTQQAAQELKEMAQLITKRNEIKWVVNSHFHGDHIRGNQMFKDSVILSSQTTYEKMKDIHPERIRKQKDELEGLASYIQSLEKQPGDENEKQTQQISFLKEIEASLPTLELVLPQQTFNNGMKFYGTKRSAEILTWGGGHSHSDAVLYIPEEKVIFMGDLLFVNTHPTLFEESNPMNWVRLLEKAASLDIEKSIPGHGAIGSKRDLLKLKSYIEELYELASGNNSENPAIPNKYQDWSSPEVFYQNMKRVRGKIDLLH
ncbi:MBL fold metallo-hydrolase [Neobacillus cucumis]|uniref:MBL fold metallo-hydrolase n=1 Tax=Neobacillus cucumis TaxID=1740721 RepID=A0A2N5HB03_9BACI|nr:MBL fold metallo-hydrolase [Neobacillus cucumis]PLS02701.1 MBL fold metallo-hydrolase [Neobacillus cucumis]